jgi:hypothetical protein
LQGWGGPDLLKSYDAERRPVFASTARDFIEKSIFDDRDFLRRHDPAVDRAGFEAAWRDRQSGARAEVNAFEPNYEGSPIVWGSPDSVSSAIGSHAYAARAGHHLTPQPLSSGKNVYQELGRGFTLIDLGASQGAPAFEHAAAKLGVPLKVIRDARRMDERNTRHARFWCDRTNLSRGPGRKQSRSISCNAPLETRFSSLVAGSRNTVITRAVEVRTAGPLMALS